MWQSRVKIGHHLGQIQITVVIKALELLHIMSEWEHNQLLVQVVTHTEVH